MTITPLQRTPLKFGTNENEERLVREYFKNNLAEIREDYEGFIQLFQDLKTLPKRPANADSASYDSLINILKLKSSMATAFQNVTDEEGHQIDQSDMETLTDFQTEIETIQRIFQDVEI